MLGENISKLRKKKGLSQETLAQYLNVVRQTISKWEKGLSVPDAEMLNSIAEVLEVPVSTLLGSTIEDEEKPAGTEIEEVAKQLAILNEQLALRSQRRRHIWKKVLLGILIAFVGLAIVWGTCFFLFRVQPGRNAIMTTKTIACTLNGEEYSYTVVYDENFRLHESGGDGFIANHVPVEQYTDANVLLAQIEDYFKDHGGTFAVVGESVQQPNR